MVTVLPLTMVVSDPRVPGTAGPKARAGDSALGRLALHRCPDRARARGGLGLPPALRRIDDPVRGCCRAPTRWARQCMRSSNLKEVPDPLRELSAAAGGPGGRRPVRADSRGALVHAPTQSDTLRCELSAVLADARTGKVVWRTLAAGKGETLADAYHAALATILATDGTPPQPMTYDVTLIPGDGIGPEITEQTVRAVEATGVQFPGMCSSPAWRRSTAHGDPASRSHPREHPEAPRRAQGAAHDAGGRRVPLGQRRAAEGIRALRQCPPRGDDPAGPLRRRRHRAGPREPRRALLRGRALHQDRRRSPRGRGIAGDRHPAGLRADRPLRLRVRAQPRPQEGHDRPQGQHPQDGERALPRGGRAPSRRSTRAGSRRND